MENIERLWLQDKLAIASSDVNHTDNLGGQPGRKVDDELRYALERLRETDSCASSLGVHGVIIRPQPRCDSGPQPIRAQRAVRSRAETPIRSPSKQKAIFKASGATWNDLRVQMRTTPALKPRLVVADGMSSVAAFLATLKFQCEEVALDDYTSQPEDILFLSPRHIGSEATATSLMQRLPYGLRVVICGPMPLNTDWMTVEGLFPGLVVAVLGSLPADDPKGWEGTIQKLASNEILGLRHYFSSDARMEHIAIQRGSARSRIRGGAITLMLEESGLANRVASVLVDAAEELVLRALTCAGGSSLDDIELTVGQEIRVAAASDENTVGFSVSELFTRTTERELARSLVTGYSSRRVDQSEDLAFLAAARAAIHLVVNILPNSACEIVCLVPKSFGHRARSFATAPRSISVFSRSS